MKRHHPMLVLMIIGGLLLAIAGGPIAFVLLVMASPLIMIMIFSIHGLVHGGGGIPKTESRLRDARRADALKPEKT